MPKPDRIKFCSLSELREKRIVTKWIESIKDEISALYAGDKVRVFSTVCPHFGGDFEYNEKKCLLRCKWHGWKFDAATGQSLTNFFDYQETSIVRKILQTGRGEPLGCFPYRGKLNEYSFEINNVIVEVAVG